MLVVLAERCTTCTLLHAGTGTGQTVDGKADDGVPAGTGLLLLVIKTM